MEEIMIVRTGLANMASVEAAFTRLGQRVVWTKDPQLILRSDRVVLPGVGAFGPAMGKMRELNLVEPLRERVAQGRPTLAICLGLQMLAAASEESPGAEGLASFEGQLERFPDGLVVPHLGWNRLVATSTCRLLRSGHVYYANSYRLREAPKGWTSATTDYGGSFVGALECGDVLACQFHPELSGAFGAALLERWLIQGGASC
jgi:imidazole glycerol phosphate synthase glutamine amidotransferase subunit